jgi:hypothetical protein
MTAALRAIDPQPFIELAGDMPQLDAGLMPQLRWIEIDKLNVDPAYQREIMASGRKNIVRIAREFEWARFATVVVAPIGDRFAIVDGQHRTTAAALRGIKKVPCQIINADRRKQAAAFAAINANVTEMSPMQLHAAKLAGGDVEADRLDKICRKAGVTILRYPIQTKNQKVGETMAPGALYRALVKFGDQVVLAALQCVTRTRDGYPGFLRSPLITALCTALQSNEDWRSSAALLPAMGKLDLRVVFETAWKSAKAGSGGGVVRALVAEISAHLQSEIGQASPRASAAASPPAATEPSAMPAATHNGVHVDVGAGRIRFAGRAANLKQREALLIALLARAMPNPVDRNFLAKRVWAKQRIPEDAAALLDQMARASAPQLGAIGLEIKVVKNVGIALRAAA